MQHTALFLIGLLAAAVLPANAATLYVDANHCPSGNGTAWSEAFCTISEAVATASPGDSVFVKAGVYNETVNIGTEVSVYGGFRGTEASPEQRDLNGTLTVIDRSTAPSKRCMTIAEVAGFTLDGFTMRGGSVPSSPPDGGAGLFTTDIHGQAVIRNCSFEDNHARSGTGADQGGGAFVQADSVLMENCQFTGNSADLGTAMYLVCEYTSTILGCRFEGSDPPTPVQNPICQVLKDGYEPLFVENCVFDCLGSENRALNLSGPATIRACQFFACNENALSTFGNLLHVSECSFYGNRPPVVRFSGTNYDPFVPSFIFEHSTIFSSRSPEYFSDPTLLSAYAAAQIYDSAFCNNGGNAIWSEGYGEPGTSMSIRHCTIANNLGTGVLSYAAPLYVENSIFSNNIDGAISSPLTDDPAVVANNLFWGNPTLLNILKQDYFNTDELNALKVAAENVVGTPAFRDSGNLDFRLLATSAALGMASAIYETYTDLYGNERPRVQGQVDAGAIQLTGLAGPHCTAITRLDPTPTNAAIVRFAVQFDVPVTNVDASDFALAAFSKSAEILGVTEQGDDYLVAVRTGIEDAAVGLNLLDDDSIRDEEGIPLGGVGRGNGNFIGEGYVVDKTPPGITLLGDSPATVAQGATYTDAGATALDAVDGDLTTAITTEDAVDTGQPGTYTVRYTVTDASGNTATAARTVFVKPHADFHITPAQQFVSQQAQDLSFDVYNRTTADAGWSANVSAGTDWCHITAGDTGIGAHGGIAIHVDANTSTAARTATIIVSDRAKGALPISVTVQQAAAPAKGFLACDGNGAPAGGNAADAGMLAGLALLLGAARRKGRA